MSDVVVVGLGYVGLPLIAQAVTSGLAVVGLDIDPDVVAGLNNGKSHVDDLSDTEVSALLSRGFTATTDPACVASAAAVVICVPTPLRSDGGPDLAAVESACRSIARHLTPDTLVVLESTTYPGTTAEIVRPMLIEFSGLDSTDIQVAYSPERIDPGNERFGMKNTPKVVGADDLASADAVRALYERFVDEVVVASGTREAESAKLLENTYRHVNIALVNEMARFFHDLDIDFWEVIRLASTKPFGFQAFTPGPGVGGHCIPIDPNYLSHRVRTQLGYGFRFVELAQEINSAMPAYVVERIAALLNQEEKSVKGSNILLLGVTYKADIADQRESPAVEVATRLLERGARVWFHDPYVDVWDVTGAEPAGEDPCTAAAEADLTVLLQLHEAYDLASLERQARRLFDTRGRTVEPTTHRL